MKYTYKIDKKTGKDSWFDSDGKPCKAPRKMPKSNRPTKYHRSGGWPMYCEASGCHISQVEEFEKMMADAGCPTSFTGGRAEYTSNAHRTKALKIRGIIDKDACYSQPSPT